MECIQVQQLLSAYLDHELETSQAQQLSEHILRCSACASALAQMEGLSTDIRQHASYHVAPPGLRARIKADLSRPTTSKLNNRINSRIRHWPWAWINLGVSGISTAAFAATLVLYLNQPSDTQIFEDEVLASHFRSLAPGHLIDVASSDRHTVKPWYAGKLDFSPPVADLAAQGYPLLGGRLDYLAGRPVAALAYQHRKHIVNLYLYPDTGKNSIDVKTGSNHGYQIVQGSNAGTHYVAVSDMNGMELKQFVSYWKTATE